MGRPLIGVFGGTFDPIHNGHIGALEQVCENVDFAELRWIVSAKPPHKNQVSASVRDRLAMLELALSEYEGWYVDDIEVRRNAPSYTFDTLTQLQSLYTGHQLVMVIGADSLANLSSWYRYSELIDLAHWVVMHRPNYDLKIPEKLQDRLVDSPEQLMASGTPCLWLHQSSEFNISSTQLRTILSDDHSSEQLQESLSLSVFNYIKTQQLYKILPMNPEQIKDQVVAALEDIKGQDITVIDIADISDFADFMVVASGTSDTHVKALAREASDRLRKQEVKPLSEDGADIGEWVLVDFGDVVLHVMRPEVRAYYDLEKLWNEDVRAMVKEHREQQGD